MNFVPAMLKQPTSKVYANRRIREISRMYLVFVYLDMYLVFYVRTVKALDNSFKWSEKALPLRT